MDPISKLADALLSVKKYIESEIGKDSAAEIISAEFLAQLEKESLQILNSCKELNSKEDFIQKINSRFDLTIIKSLYKTEQIFLFELFKIYNSSQSKDNKKSQFVLAYYFDSLRNNHFAAQKDLNLFNQLLQTDEFSKIAEKILTENKISTLNPEDGNILLSVLSLMKNSDTDKFQEYFKNFKRFSEFPVVEEKMIAEQTLKSETDEPAININVSQAPPDDSLDKVLAELNNLIGLDNVKKDISELINLLEIKKKREAVDLKNIDISLHAVFLGPPGTGKTTVARLLSRIYKHLGYLTDGQMYETDREGLVAGYVGQTAIKTTQVVKESIGGVLFIDEAYSLYQSQGSNDFGSEAVNTIIKRMEDNRKNLSVVVAGYTDPMEIFINSNPGLRSRFNRYFYFNHFTTDQLVSIFEKFCENSDFVISDDARVKLRDTFSLMADIKSESFGNARVVRNLFEKIVQNQANRLIHWSEPKEEFLKNLLEEDIPEPAEILASLKNQFIKEEEDIDGELKK